AAFRCGRYVVNHALRLSVAIVAALLALPPVGVAQSVPAPHETPLVPVSAPKPLPLKAPTRGVYSQPMATITGTGAVRFRITLGMLVDKTGKAVGLYRSYPSKARSNLSEQYGLGMLQTPAGVILSSDGNLPILVLHGGIGGGPTPTRLMLSYLTSAATRHYATKFLLVRQFGTRWAFVAPSGQRLCGFRVASSRFGVRAVESIACPAPRPSL
ncbi:MAG TPA: hypothetical protein VFQ95_02270, partial [Rhodanobacteraceae bacterium]|nr:hypothetical protein [Rhodanobacteraceae bacterium]